MKQARCMLLVVVSKCCEKQAISIVFDVWIQIPRDLPVQRTLLLAASITSLPVRNLPSSFQNVVLLRKGTDCVVTRQAITCQLLQNLGKMQEPRPNMWQTPWNWVRMPLL